MVEFGAFVRSPQPYPHWTAQNFISAGLLNAINSEWPGPSPEWRVEAGSYANKRALMFPRALPRSAQMLADHLYSEASLIRLSDMTGIDLLPDPWYSAGPLKPYVGGGLHEIYPGGLLGVHTDFTVHPTGLYRRLNFLIYLNQDWRSEWGGQLQLVGERGAAYIPPMGGSAVMFATSDKTWHGHPEPLRCPEGRARRSLALYYYSKEAAPGVAEQMTTVYRKRA